MMVMPTINLVNSLEDVPWKERNLGLVVEVPKVGEEGSYGRAENRGTALNSERWRFVSDIHIVMPNVQQVYLFRSLQYKHYHCDKDELEQYIIASGLDIVLHVHEATVDLFDHPFVKVINVGFDERTQQIISSIPWKSIAKTLYKDTIVPAVTEETVDPIPVPKRQQFHKDVGYTSGKCVIAKDELGVNLPILKPIDDDHRAAMVALSSLLKSHVFQDLKDTVYFDALNLERMSSFAGKLDPNNILEALRSALSNVQHPCGCHDDTHNDSHPRFSPVITVSVFLEIDGVVYRLALIGYSRKAIREYYERRNKPEAKLIGVVKTMLESLPESRLGWTESVQIINGIHP